MSTLYFAYGSNLHRGDWERFCHERGFVPGGLRFLRRAWLPDYEVSFRYRSRSRVAGALTLEPRVGTATPGALFEVDATTLEALDVKESVSEGRYKRAKLVALDERGEEYACLSYVVTEAHHAAEPVAPTAEYHRLVSEGLKKLGWPTARLDEAARGAALGMTPNHLFIYGTLMQGESRWHWVEPHVDGEVLAGRIPGRLLHLGRYPGLLPAEGSEAVEGELVPMRLSGELIQTLDEIEGFLGYGESGSLYRRVIREVEAGGDRIWAWTYRYLGEPAEGSLIPSGNWRDR